MDTFYSILDEEESKQIWDRINAELQFQPSIQVDQLPFQLSEPYLVLDLTYATQEQVEKLLAEVPGALAASVGWVAFSFLFSIYVNYGGGSRFYGSMAIALLSLLWLYFCMSILFYGAVLCRLSQQGRLSFRYMKNFSVLE